VIVCYKLVLAFFYLPVVISSVAKDGKLGGRQGEDARMSVAFPGKTGTILDLKKNSSCGKNPTSTLAIS